MPRVVEDWTPEFKDWVFVWWMEHNRPSVYVTYKGLPRPNTLDYPDEFMDKHFKVPTATDLQPWMDEFKARAGKLDMEARNAIDQTLVEAKVEMLKRHAEIGVNMQDMALDYLEAHRDDLGVGSSVKLLIEGLRIERESKGIPETLRKMSEMSDEKLMNEIKNLFADAPVELLQLPDEDEDGDNAETV